MYFQADFRNKKKQQNLHDGYYWTYNTFGQWQDQFPFWCVRTLKTIFSKLENKKIIVSGNYNKFKFDRTKWYRIDYIRLEQLENTPIPIVQDLHNAKCNFVTMQKAKFAPPIPETNTEITSEITFNGQEYQNKEEEYKKEDNGCQTSLPTIYNLQDFCLKLLETDNLKNISEIDLQCVKYYVEKYEEVMGKEHPYYRISVWGNQIATIRDGENGQVYDVEDIISMIDKHFETEYGWKCDYSILHFNTGGIKKNRFYEICRGK